MRLAFKDVNASILYCGEMIFIPGDHEGKGFAEDDAEFILLGFYDSHLQLCDEFAIENLSKYNMPAIRKSISTPIYPPMQMVLDSVRFYLNNKISCIHLHAIKQKEVFLIFRTFSPRCYLSLNCLISITLNFSSAPKTFTAFRSGRIFLKSLK